MQYKPKKFPNLRKSFLSKKAQEIHAGLYEGYVSNTNKSQEKIRSGDKSSPELSEVRRRLGWEWNGMRLHELYFKALGGNGKIDQTGKLFSRIQENFGSFEDWQNDFVSTAKMRGIGWIVLYQDGEKLFNFWINEHDEGHPAGANPLLVLDVFEHAFFPDFGKDKGSYIEAFFGNIDWEVMEKRIK